MLHLLASDEQDGLGPVVDAVELLPAQPFVDAPLQRKGGEQVLAAQQVLQLGRLGQEVDEFIPVAYHWQTSSFTWWSGAHPAARFALCLAQLRLTPAHFAADPTGLP